MIRQYQRVIWHIFRRFHMRGIYDVLMYKIGTSAVEVMATPGIGHIKNHIYDVELNIPITKLNGSKCLNTSEICELYNRDNVTFRYQGYGTVEQRVNGSISSNNLRYTQ